MLNKSFRSVAAGLLALTLALTACGTDDDPDVAADDDTDTEAPDVDDDADDDGDDDAAEPDGDAVTIRIGTSSAAGAFYAMAGGLADTLNREGNFNATAQTTPGSSAPNVGMLAVGDIQLGYVTADQAFEGYRGERAFPDANEGLRAVAAGNLAEIQIVARADSGIESFEDLAGARIGAGAEGSLTENTLMAILDAYGIDDWTPVYGSNADNLDSLRDGTVDAVNTPLAAPSPGLTEVESTLDLNWLALDDDAIDTVTEEHPYWVPVSIEAGVYDTLEEEYTTIAYPTVIVTQDTVDDDVIYDVLTILYDFNDELQDVHPCFEQWTHENAARGVEVPFHPGAERYFEEQGVDIETDA
jgi:uncharacterized protein